MTQKQNYDCHFLTDICVFSLSGRVWWICALISSRHFKYYLSGYSIANFPARIYHIISELTYEEVFTNTEICWLKMFFIFLIENITYLLCWDLTSRLSREFQVKLYVSKCLAFSRFCSRPQTTFSWFRIKFSLLFCPLNRESTDII